MAVALAREQLGDLVGRTVVIVGTGETGELTARALADSGGRPVFVASRRRDRAISLARRYGGESVSFDELPQALERADILVAATASPHLLLEAAELAEVWRSRGRRPLLLIDLAVPRDIDAACGEIDGVSLYDIDDLQAVIARNRKVRQAEARKAEGIIEEEIQQLRRLARIARGAADAGGAARPRHRDRRTGRRRERRQVGGGCRSATGNGWTRWPARSSTGSCTAPRRASRSSATTACTPGWR